MPTIKRMASELHSAMTISQLVGTATAQLLAALSALQGPEVSYTHADAALDARLLLNHVSQLSTTAQLTYPEKVLPEAQFMQFGACLEERLSGKPLAYIIGEQAFYDSVFKVAPCTLIPRSETEMLVDLARDKAPLQGNILDLGTGTGAIGLSLAKARPDTQVTCVDFVPEAVALATQNATALAINNAQILQSDWFGQVTQGFHIIVSNPPYIEPDSPYLTTGDCRFEPHTALASADHGLADIKVIVGQAPHYLEPNGWLLLEHGFAQGSAVRALFASAGFTQVETVCDYAQQPRITLGKITCT